MTFIHLTSLVRSCTFLQTDDIDYVIGSKGKKTSIRKWIYTHYENEFKNK